MQGYFVDPYAYLPDLRGWAVGGGPARAIPWALNKAIVPRSHKALTRRVEADHSSDPQAYRHDGITVCRHDGIARPTMPVSSPVTTGWAARAPLPAAEAGIIRASRGRSPLSFHTQARAAPVDRGRTCPARRPAQPGHPCRKQDDQGVRDGGACPTYRRPHSGRGPPCPARERRPRCEGGLDRVCRTDVRALSTASIGRVRQL
jgi:hypothetical protein